MNLCSPFSYFSTILLFSFTFLDTSVSFSDSLYAQTPLAPVSGGEKYDAGFLLGAQRSFVEGPISEPVENPSFSSVVLAAERTNRKDPLNGFKRYTGGWNISQTHYWASVGFTAVPLFAISLTWFIIFGLCFSVIYFCCLRGPQRSSQTTRSLSLIFLIIFTIATILGCILMYVGQAKFHKSTTRTLDYVVGQADQTVEKIVSVSDMLAGAKRIAVDQILLPSNVQTDIDQIEEKLNSSASFVSQKVSKNSKNIHNVLDSVMLALIIVAAIMLLLTFLGLLFSIFGMQSLVCLLVILGWILVTGTLILSGIFVILHNMVADTCVAMDEWVQNPTPQTALDDILPCADGATAQETILRSKEITSELVDLINQVITNMSNINFSPNFVPLYYNQSGPLMPLLCNPFYHDLTERDCSLGEVDLSNATQAWNNYVCQVSSSGICMTTGRITPSLYDQMSAAVSMSSTLYHDSPILVDLEDCTFVRDTFSNIHYHHCPGIKQSSKSIYIGLVMASTSLVFSVLLWLVYAKERRYLIQERLEEKTLQ